MSQLSYEKRMDILTRSLEASARGDEDEALRISQEKPLTPWIAKATREIFGAEYLKGWDLSEAEAEYGKDWLNK